MQSNNKTQGAMIKKLIYRVSHDWTPYQFWTVQAESEIEARMSVATELGCELSELEARLR